MGYPYGKTYLEQIQDSKNMREDVHNAYLVLLHQFCKEQGIEDIEVTLKEQFGILAEAFEYGGVSGCVDDTTHFMQDVIHELLYKDSNE